MTVYVVYSEFNRGYDAETSAVVEGVFTTQALAAAAADACCVQYRNQGIPAFGDGEDDTDDEWGVDVQIEVCEVQK